MQMTPLRRGTPSLRVGGPVGAHDPVDTDKSNNDKFAPSGETEAGWGYELGDTDTERDDSDVADGPAALILTGSF